jgi:hypothetical protein
MNDPRSPDGKPADGDRTPAPELHKTARPGTPEGEPPAAERKSGAPAGNNDDPSQAPESGEPRDKGRA